MIRRILFTLAITLPVNALGFAAEQADGKTPPSPEAQAKALSAVTDFFLKPDPDRAARHLAPSASYRSNRQGSAKQMIDELKELQQSKKPFPSVRELGFFTSADVLLIRERLRDYKGASRMFGENRVPAYLKDGFGCYIVTYPLEVGERGEAAVIVMVFREIDGVQQIVYIDDN